MAVVQTHLGYPLLSSSHSFSWWLRAIKKILNRLFSKFMVHHNGNNFQSFTSAGKIYPIDALFCFHWTSNRNEKGASSFAVQCSTAPHSTYVHGQLAYLSVEFLKTNAFFCSSWHIFVSLSKFILCILLENILIVWKLSRKSFAI